MQPGDLGESAAESLPSEDQKEGSSSEGQGQMWEGRMCLQLCGRHPREQEGKGGVARALEIRGEPGPRHCRLPLPFWMLDARPPHPNPQPPESPASLSWTP